MARPTLKAMALLERLRESLWLIPGVMVVAAGGLASALVPIKGPAPDVPLRQLLLPAGAEAAVPVLQVVAASVITVTSVVFSLTVVALQITAGNYSPRALRTFLRDLGTQMVLGTFLATFTYAFLVLQNIRPLRGAGQAEWAPQVAFVAVPGFVLASLIALVFFIHHVTQAIRVDLILKEVLEESLDSIDTVHADRKGDTIDKHPRDLVPENAREITSTSTGFVQTFGFGSLLPVTREQDVVVAYRPSAGDHVLEGATLAWCWSRKNGSGNVGDELESAIREAVQVGRERSMDHDVAYGIRQLVDVAVRALSPGVNDPNTAVASIHHLTVLYKTLLERQLGPRIVRDEDADTARIVVPYPTLSEYLTIMVQQVGHYGRGDLMVVLRLLRQLGELKSLADERDHAALDEAIADVVAEAERGIDVSSHLDLIREAATDAKELKFRFRHYTAAG
jgi:uncharacterized membrane protein